MAEDKIENIDEQYGDDKIKHLDDTEHIRRRPGMYIGRLGNGDNPGDGIYVLLKEIVDNSIDEYSAGYGKQIRITIEGQEVTVRDFGRGIPLNSVVDATSKLNTGGKFDDSVFKKSVGLNGVGTKAVNALSSTFYVESCRDGVSSFALFSRGVLQDSGKRETTERNGTPGFLVLIPQSCLTLCDTMNCSPPNSSVHGISQVKILEWVAIPFSRGSS